MRRALMVGGSLWTLLHVYVGLRLIGPVGLGWPETLGAWLGLVTLAFAPVGALAAMRAAWTPWGRLVQWIGFTALGLSSLLIVLVAAADVVRVRAWGPSAATVS